MTAPNTESAILERIAALLKIEWGESQKLDVPGELYMSTVSIAAQVYGQASPQVNALIQAKADIRDSNWATRAKESRLVLECQGVLRAIAGDIRAGLTRSIRLQSQAEVFADLLLFAKSSLDAGAKDAAAVLSSAALEDSLKQLARGHGLSVDDRDMSDVIGALKSQGLVSGPQGTLLKGFVQIRNKAFHAEWAKIDEADVRSLIAFTEQFLLVRLA